MKESVTYQAIIEEGKTEGRLEGSLNTLLLIGRTRWGEPSKKVRSVLQAIKDLGKLQEMTIRMAEVHSREEFLARPKKKQSNDSKKKKLIGAIGSFTRTAVRAEMLKVLGELSEDCPAMRLGQLVANLATLA